MELKDLLALQEWARKLNFGRIGKDKNVKKIVEQRSELVKSIDNIIWQRYVSDEELWPVGKLKIHQAIVSKPSEEVSAEEIKLEFSDDNFEDTLKSIRNNDLPLSVVSGEIDTEVKDE